MEFYGLFGNTSKIYQSPRATGEAAAVSFMTHKSSIATSFMR
jgi:hypothetical protein